MSIYKPSFSLQKNKNADNSEVAVVISYDLETSDHRGHDGYCTDDECVYEKTYGYQVVPVKKYILEKYPYDDPNNFKYYEPFLNIPEIKFGSKYCDLSDQCEENGLTRHDFRFTITDIDPIGKHDKDYFLGNITQDYDFF